jgi:type I restriction enzyme S subunit
MAAKNKRQNHGFEDFTDFNANQSKKSVQSEPSVSICDSDNNQSNHMIQKNHSADKWEVPEGWEVFEVGELFEFKNGINAGKESYGKGIKFINVMEVIYHDFITPDMIPGTVQISEEQKDLYLVKDGDVLFNRTSETIEEIGMSAVYNGKEDVVFGGFVIRGRPIINAIDSVYKRYCLRSNLVRNQIIKGGQGAVRTNIGQGDLSLVKILLPPLPEQRAIAQVLSTADAAIHTTEKLIAQKELRKKWLMQQLLTGKKRLFSRDKIGDMNYEMRKVKLGNLIKLASGDTKPYDTNQDYTSTYQFPVYGGNGIMCYSKEFNSNNDKIIIGRVGEYCGITRMISQKCWITDNALHTTQIDNCVSIQYLIYKLQYEDLSKLRSIGGQPLVSQKPIYSLSLIIHNSLREQTAIAQVLQAADKEISLLKAKTEKLREQKKGLMQVLLTGKKRLTI